MNITNISILLISTLSGVIGQICLKKGTQNLKLDFLDFWGTAINLITNAWIWTWFIMGVLSVLTWILIVSRFSINWAYPVIMSLSYILIMILSYIFLNEKISIQILIGTILMVSGIIVSSLDMFS